MEATTREQVLEEILARILGQDDDNDPRHDGYQRRMVLVEGRSAEDADAACTWLATRVRDTHSKRREDELVEITCEEPPGRKRYEFGPKHTRDILVACAIPDAHRIPAWRAHMHDIWPKPVLLFVRNADAMGRTGRTGRRHLQTAGDWIRSLTDNTRVRQVLFGSAPLGAIYQENESFRNRTDAYHLDPEENRRRMRAGNQAMSELNWKFASGATVH